MSNSEDTPSTPPIPQIEPSIIPAPTSVARRFFGELLIVVGVLLVLVSGLCSALVIGIGIAGGGADLLGAAFMIGAPFILLGALMWWGGKSLRK